MTTTLETMRQRVSETIGDHYSGTATSNGGDTSSVIDTGLIGLTNGGDTDAFKGYYVLITESGHAAEGEKRRVTTYDETTGDLTLHAAISGELLSGEAYELHRYDPDQKNTAVNRAAGFFHFDLHAPVIDETVFTNNLLTNSGFESAISGGAHPSWTNTGGGTVTAETSRVWHGSQSAKVVADGGADHTLSQNIYTSGNVHEMVGKTLRVEGRVWASAGSAARLRVSFDGGSTFTNGDYHDGDGEWEDHELDAEIPDDATSMTVYCETTNGETAYFDDVTASIDDLYTYTVSGLFDDGPNRVEIQVNKDQPNGPYRPLTRWYVETDGSTRFLRFDHMLPSGHVLRLHGRDHLSALSADSDTVEVDDSRQYLLAEMAASELFTALAGDASGQGMDLYERLANKHRDRAEQLWRTPGVRQLQGATLSQRLVRN